MGIISVIGERVHEKQLSSDLVILKCYTCITSLFEAFDQEIWSYTYIVCYEYLIAFSISNIQIMPDGWFADTASQKLDFHILRI